MSQNLPAIVDERGRVYLSEEDEQHVAEDFQGGVCADIQTRTFKFSHVCRESKTCTCSLLALEPEESCPQHGVGEWPPRCVVCGRFMKWQ